MKKILIAILVLCLVFAVIRITTSTYENIKRRSVMHVIQIDKWGDTY